MLFSTEDNAFLIETAADLQALADYVNSWGDTNGYNFKVTADIDMKGINFKNPIGNSNARQFRGTFDGGNHTISNLNVDGAERGGLFGYNFGTIQNLNVVNANIIGYAISGGLVSVNSGTIKDCNVISTVRSVNNFYTGGIVGNNSDTVENCYYHSNAGGSGEKVNALNLPEGVEAQISGETLQIGEKYFCKQGATVTLDATKLKEKYYTLNLSAGEIFATDNGDNTYTLTLGDEENIKVSGLLKIDGLNRFDGGAVLIGSYDELKALADWVQAGKCEISNTDVPIMAMSLT